MQNRTRERKKKHLERHVNNKEYNRSTCTHTHKHTQAHAQCLQHCLAIRHGPVLLPIGWSSVRSPSFNGNATMQAKRQNHFSDKVICLASNNQ